MAQELLPVIGLPACVKSVEDQPFHAVGDKYVQAARLAAGGAPLIIPALGWEATAGGLALEPLLDQLDGVLLTGSLSNVDPGRYGGPAPRPGNLADDRRDATTLPLIGRVLDKGIPLLAICRGLQELNVALGGTLHQHVHELPGRLDHRAPDKETADEVYGPVHPVRFAEGGVLAALAGRQEAMVNSLHGQGIDRLAPGLEVEATAPDGQIEAVRVAGARAFALAVQWHPEYKAMENPLSRAIFGAFGDAARARCRARRGAAARAAE